MSNYDSTRMELKDLAPGFIFEYDLSTWEVIEEYEYDWGNGFYTREFKVSDGTEIRFLDMEKNDLTQLAFFDKVELHAIDPGLTGQIIDNDEPPRELRYNGVIYHLKESNNAYWRDVTNSDWEPFVNWDYSDVSGEQLLTIERWGEEEFEASVGKKIKNHEISNILPREGSAKRAPRVKKSGGNKARQYFWLILLGLVFIVFGLARCGGGSSASSYGGESLAELKSKYAKADAYTILLNDMDVQRSGWSSDFLHKYRILETEDSTVNTHTTDWTKVDESFFRKHENDLGMELVSKTEDGTITDNVAPPGYSNYIGNDRYGKWKTDNSGNRFWEFYGRYMFMSSMFNLMAQPVYYPYYNTYRGSYFGRRPYYGPTFSGRPYYGTRSSFTQKQRPDFFQRRARKGNFSKSYSATRRQSRSGSRFGGSSSRSRGGGFGK